MCCFSVWVCQYSEGTTEVPVYMLWSEEVFPDNFTTVLSLQFVKDVPFLFAKIKVDAVFVKLFVSSSHSGMAMLNVNGTN